MESFQNFYGNLPAARTLRQAIASARIPQTILLSGPEGVGKATLARRFAAELLGYDAQKIERDDLSLPENIETIEQREKWPAEKRAEDPLLFSTHPDFITFAPDGPLRQITIQQMRLLRERAQFKPLRGAYRIFLIDRLDRANGPSANSLLKTLEEPPEHLVVIATTNNLYDLLPTIRSRSFVLQLGRLADTQMREFCAARQLSDTELRIALAEGCPGLAVTLDLDVFRERRALLLAALECAAGIAPFSHWIQHSEAFANRKSEKLDYYLKLAYGLLEDVLSVANGKPPAQHRDIQPRIAAIGQRVSFSWIEQAVKAVDELTTMVRRNIQKVGAVDALIINLRNRQDAVSA